MWNSLIKKIAKVKGSAKGSADDNAEGSVTLIGT